MEQAPVKDVSEYLKKVKEYISNHDNETYYRGHASESWELSPTLGRSQHFEDEFKLLNEATSISYFETNDRQSYFRRLVLFQHYGLRTRLLDLTFNPLVALFFACQKCEDNKSGIVYIGQNELQQDMRSVEYISKYIFTNPFDQEMTEKTLKKASKDCDINDLFKPLIIKPELCNERILAQNGAFVMMPLLKDKKHSDEITYEKYNICKYNEEELFNYKITVSVEDKEDILEELSFLGFNRAKLFPDMQNKMEYINDKYGVPSSIYNNKKS